MSEPIGQGLHYALLPKDDPVAALSVLLEAAGLGPWPVLVNLDITPGQLHTTFDSNRNTTERGIVRT